MSQSNAAKVVSMNLLFVLIEKISLLLNQTHIRSFFSLSATYERIMSPVLYSRWYRYTFLWIIYHTACYTNKQEITDSGLELQHATPRYFSSPVSGALFYISFELIFWRCLVWRYIILHFDDQCFFIFPDRIRIFGRSGLRKKNLIRIWKNPGSETLHWGPN